MGKASRKKKPAHVSAPVAAPSRTRAFPWWLIAVLLLTAFLAYARTLSYDFVYDDEIQVLRNSWIRDWSHVGNFFFTDVWAFYDNQPSNYYRPLHMVAHAAGYTISGLNPFGFHLINILLHCLCSVLAALIGYRLTRDGPVSAAGGFLFALHPVHAESVSWIAGVTDPLCAAFYFGSIYTYLDRDLSKQAKTGLLSAGLFLGALLSKEMAFTLPLVLVLLDICLNRKLQWKRYLAFAVSFGIYAGLRIQALQHFQVTQLTLNMSPVDRLLNSIVLLGEYITKAFVPFNINAFHVFVPTATVLDIRFVLSVLALAAFACGAWFFRTDRSMLFLFAAIPLSLLPVLNLSGIGENLFADRYLYIPSLGACLLIPILAQKAGKWIQQFSGVGGRKVAIGLASAIGVVFAFVLWNTVFMWRDNITLYTETLKRSPSSAKMAANLARSYVEAGRIKEAEYWALQSEEKWKHSYIRLDRELARNYVRLSSIYLKEQRASEALDCLRKAYGINPHDEGVLQNLMVVLIMTKNYGEARRACEASLAINPKNEIAYNNLAFLLLEQKAYGEAIANARKAIEIFPKYGDAYLNLARGYAGTGSTEQARDAYRIAKRMNPALQPAVDQELILLK